jgi:Rrf2 family protein
MELSRSSEYAINVALQLAQAETGAPFSAAELAQAGDMPERYLQHILRRLAEHGVLSATRGVAGGYTLARPARQITLLQLVEAAENLANSKPKPKGSRRHAAGAPLANALEKASRAVNAELKKVTLADLIGKKTRRPRQPGAAKSQSPRASRRTARTPAKKRRTAKRRQS